MKVMGRFRRRARAGASAAADAPVRRPAVALSDYSADAGLPFDAAELESRLVWMWGSPRSGSTWLLRQLAHPLVPEPEAVEIFSTPDDATGPFDAIPVDESFISNHFAPAFADPREVDGAYVPGTINNYLGERPVYAFARDYEAIWRPEARRFALVRLFGFLDRARRDGVPLTDDPLLVIKEVNGSHAADLMMSLMPRSRMLFLVRDGRDVVDSLLHAYQPGGFLARHQGRAFETAEERADGLLWAARLWACNVDMTLRAMDRHPVELSRVIKYEDLLADNRGQVAGLFRWLGLERSAEWLDGMLDATAFDAIPAARKGSLERNRAAQPGLWRQNLSTEEQRVAEEIMGPRLRKLGYDTEA